MPSNETSHSFQGLYWDLWTTPEWSWFYLIKSGVFEVVQRSSYYPWSQQLRERGRRGGGMLSAVRREPRKYISWSCWDLSCLCHWATSPIFFQEPEPRRGMVGVMNGIGIIIILPVLLVISSILLINCWQKEEGVGERQDSTLKILCKNCAKYCEYDVKLISW